MRTTLILSLLTAAVAVGITGCGNDDDSPRTVGKIPAEATYNGYTSLVSAVGAADPAVATALNGAGPLTVFAPSNAAFTAVSSLTATFTPTELANVLTYHVLAGSVNSTAAIAVANSAGEADTVNGAKVYLDVVGGSLYVNQAKVVKVNLPASNGIIHGIDAVITVPETIYDTLQTYGLTTLQGAVNDAGLDGSLKGSGSFTVFAPTNNAFAAVASTVAGLNTTQLGNVLKYHVLTSTVKASGAIAVAGSSSNQVDTLLGGTEKLTLTFDGRVLKVNDAQVTSLNIRCTNGVIHVIDRVLLPSPGGIG